MLPQKVFCCWRKRRGAQREVLGAALTARLLFENVNSQLRKSQRRFLCACGSERASTCVRTHWLGVVKIKARLWADNRSKKSTFLTSRPNRKQINLKEFICGIFGLVFFSCNSKHNYRIQTLNMQTFFTTTQMQADNTRVHTHAQQVLTGWRPHSQNTDMQISNVQTERQRWDKDRGAHRTGMGKKSEQMGEWRDDWWLKRERKQGTEMSDKKMKWTLSEPQSSSESNASSYYSSSVHRQQQVPAWCLKTKLGISLLLCVSAAQTLSSP